MVFVACYFMTLNKSTSVLPLIILCHNIVIFFYNKKILEYIFFGLSGQSTTSIGPQNRPMPAAPLREGLPGTLNFSVPWWLLEQGNGALCYSFVSVPGVYVVCVRLS